MMTDDQNIKRSASGIMLKRSNNITKKIMKSMYSNSTNLEV